MNAIVCEADAAPIPQLKHSEERLARETPSQPIPGPRKRKAVAKIAITFSIMGAVSAGYVQGGEAVDAAMAHGAQRSYLACSFLALAAFVAALFIRKGAPSGGAVVATH